MRSKGIASALIMLGLLVVPASTFAQSSDDSNWAPWLGCWRLMQESVRDTGEGLVPPRLPDQNANDFRVCVVPNDSGPGVSMRTFADRRSIRSRNIVVDGAPHPVDETECQGTQVGQWSRDGHRLFTRTNLECKDQKKRTISGITFMTMTSRGPAWVDVQGAHVNGNHVVTVRRYTRTADEREPGDAPSETVPPSASPALRAAAQPFTIEDVIEAGSKTTSESLEAALVEASPRFDLNRRTLTRLDDAGIPGRVIDLMVGLTFPGRFRVERRRQFSQSAPVGGGAWDATRWDGDAGWYPYDPLWSADPYDLYYLSPFAFPYWWSGYAFDAWPSGGVLIGKEQKDAGGRAVQGLGYTRVRSNREAAASGNGTGGTKSSEGTSSRQGYTLGGNSSSGSSGSGGGSSSGGTSSNGGGGSSGSGRTAQPR